MSNLRDGLAAMERSAILRKSLRWLAVVASLAAWFALSNHCALAVSLVSQNPDGEMGDCPMHTAPAKKKPAPNTPCCKDVRAVVAKAAVAASPLLRLLGSLDYTPQIVVPPPREATDIESLDTGPPGRFSFAELVLQKSVLAHAPPLS